MNTIGYHGRRSSIDLSDSTRANALENRNSRNLNLRTSPRIRGAASAPSACSHGPLDVVRGITRRPARLRARVAVYRQRDIQHTRLLSGLVSERVPRALFGQQGGGQQGAGQHDGATGPQPHAGSRVRNRNRRPPTPAGSRPTSNEPAAPFGTRCRLHVGRGAL